MDRPAISPLELASVLLDLEVPTAPATVVPALPKVALATPMRLTDLALLKRALNA